MKDLLTVQAQAHRAHNAGIFILISRTSFKMQLGTSLAWRALTRAGFTLSLIGVGIFGAMKKGMVYS